MRVASRREIERLTSEMEELFTELWNAPRLMGTRRGGFRPRVDVYRREEPPAIVVVVELAGVDPSGIELAVADGVLLLAGERLRGGASGRVYQQMEVDYGSFRRRIPLEEPIDADRVEASYDQGILTITLPVAARAGGRFRVPITEP